MKTIGIVFFSAGGATRLLAEQIGEGIISAGHQYKTYEVSGADITEGRYTNQALLEELGQCDGIVFGSPTYMGAAAGQFKSFMDASSDEYVKQAWHNKIAAGFTTGGSLNGEQQQTLLSFFTLAMQHGMLWAGLNSTKHIDNLKLNRTGSSIGLVASVDPNNGIVHDNDLKTGFYFGQRIAALTTLCTNH